MISELIDRDFISFTAGVVRKADIFAVYETFTEAGKTKELQVYLLSELEKCAKPSMTLKLKFDHDRLKAFVDSSAVRFARGGKWRIELSSLDRIEFINEGLAQAKFSEGERSGFIDFVGEDEITMLRSTFNAPSRGSREVMHA